MSVPCFIPSKNRAQQLNLLLNSLQKNAPGMYVPHILYTYSNDDFKAGYEKLKQSTPRGMTVVWQEEHNAYDQFTGFLHNYKNHPCVALSVDDLIFYRPTSFTEELITDFLSQDEVWSVHLRIGKNIIITDYVTDKYIDYPKTLKTINILKKNELYKQFLTWNYREAHPQRNDHYWFFPSPFDFSLYRANDLINLLGNNRFELICLYEHEICHNGNQDKTLRDHIVSPLFSEVVAMVYNSAHSYGHRTKGQVIVSLEEFNQRYLNDEIIDLESIDFSNVRSAHNELPFSWRKK